MTPSELVKGAMRLLKKDGATSCCVRLDKGSCFITDEEGFPYSSKGRKYSAEMAQQVVQHLQRRGYTVQLMGATTAAVESTSLRRTPLMEDFRRMVGVAPTLMEKAAGSDRAMLDALSKAFPMKVKPADVPFIRYRIFRDSVEMEDVKGRLGDVLTSVEKREADPKALVAWLKAHGAKPMKAS